MCLHGAGLRLKSGFGAEFQNNRARHVAQNCERSIYFQMSVTAQRSEHAVETIGVLVCSYRRPDNLSKCLGGIERQTRRPDEVIVVVRSSDTHTLDYIHSRNPETLPLKMLTVEEPGLVAARNIGAAAFQSDVLAITDDDAVPHSDWLERIVNHFAASPDIGGVGGRDQCFANGMPIPATTEWVGKLLWNGKHVGNHHLGRGPARTVDLIKGCNMSYRREALKAVHFEERLHGSGSQACEDLAVSRAVANNGWTLIYDPAVLVDHFEGKRSEPRHYASVMISDPQGFEDSVYNQFVAIWNSLTPGRRLYSLVYFFFVGTRAAPGLLQAFRFTPSLGIASWVRFWIAQKGRFKAYRDMSEIDAPERPVSASRTKVL